MQFDFDENNNALALWLAQNRLGIEEWSDSDTAVWNFLNSQGLIPNGTMVDEEVAP